MAAGAAEVYRRAVRVCLAMRKVTEACLIAAHRKAYGTKSLGGLKARARKRRK